jgi:hypothetical protein
MGQGARVIRPMREKNKKAWWDDQAFLLDSA